MKGTTMTLETRSFTGATLGFLASLSLTTALMVVFAAF
jgi:hypothetical protein